MGRKRLEICGKKFNRLTAIIFIKIDQLHNSNWLFKCDCGTEKILGAKHVKTGHIKSCGCLNIEHRIAFAINHNKSKDLINNKWCWRCQKELPRSNFWKSSGENDGLKRNCKNCIKKYMRQRRISDLKYKSNCNIKTAIYKSLKDKKMGKHWEDLVNYKLNDLMIHLESKFQPGMSWQNYGKYGWHIDHIKPISLFKYNSYDDQEFKDCWSLNNLQPLWAKENLSKGNQYTGN
ncbi:MAG: hypothetical protein AABY22_22560 [Nanoarchaeota archaeon]